MVGFIWAENLDRWKSNLSLPYMESCSEKQYCKDYLYQYFLYDVELLAKEQQGGIMSHIAKEMMEKRECRFPEFDKQKEIAQTLSQLDEHIRLLEKECDAWMLKKKALMQLLLTGIVRAKV